MLKFSASFDLKKVDTRYKNLLSVKKYQQEFAESLKKLFVGRSTTFKKNQFYGAGNIALKHEDILIYEPGKGHFLIHLDFDFGTKAVQAFLVRKEHSTHKNESFNVKPSGKGSKKNSGV
mmetsp:Transcript_39829/g.38392  ORF Transcript_39829/g.38392 Transcript_39829/m.38392 type:complete len:119 (+) Transcript_39829:2794-3150(+)